MIYLDDPFLSPHCVKTVRIRSYSGPCFPAFRLNAERYSVSLRIQPECAKIRTRITPNTDTVKQIRTAVKQIKPSWDYTANSKSKKKIFEILLLIKVFIVLLVHIKWQKQPFAGFLLKSFWKLSEKRTENHFQKHRQAKVCNFANIGLHRCYFLV